VDCSRAIYEQDLKKVAIPLKIVAVFEPSEKSCQFSEEKRHFSEKKKWFVQPPLPRRLRRSRAGVGTGRRDDDRQPRLPSTPGRPGA
jgi:hypothetical protein